MREWQIVKFKDYTRKGTINTNQKDSAIDYIIY